MGAFSFTMETPALFDERRTAGFRFRFQRELGRALHVDSALEELRLGELSPAALRGLTRCTLRVVTVSLPATRVAEEARALSGSLRGRLILERVSLLLESGRLQLRVTPFGGWCPDFTVFSDERGPRSVIIGGHDRSSSGLFPGPAWGVHWGRREASAAVHRFEELWESGYDALESVRNALKDPLTPFRPLGRILAPHFHGPFPGSSAG